MRHPVVAPFLMIIATAGVRSAECPLARLIKKYCESAGQDALLTVERFTKRSAHRGDEWECIKALEPLVAEKPNPLLHLIIGAAACERNLYRFAQDHLEKAVSGLQEQVPDHPEIQFASLYWLGKALLGQGEDDKAKDVLSQTLETAKGQSDAESLFWPGRTFCDTLAKSLLARLLFDYQHEKEALVLLEQVKAPVDGARYRPEGDLHQDLAACYSAVGDARKALGCYEQTLKRANLNACDSQVEGLKGVIGISAGWFHNLAVVCESPSMPQEGNHGRGGR